MGKLPNLSSIVRNTTKLLGVAALSTALSCDYVSNTPVTKNDSQNSLNSQTVFDNTRGSYLSSAKGIDEQILNTFKNDEFCTKWYNDYAFSVDSMEKQIHFTGLSEWETDFNQVDSIAMDNLMTITALHMFPMEMVYTDGLKEEYVDLRILLNKLDSIDLAKTSYVSKLNNMYNAISEAMPYQSDIPDVGYVGVVDLMNCVNGDCGDYTPAYLSLLSYYGFNISYRFGREFDAVYGYRGIHTWLTVDLPNNKSMDLDPTWYPDFIPLEERNSALVKYYLK